MGITSKNHEKRFKAHLIIARSKKIKKGAIHRAIEKHGEDNFKLSLLQVCETFEELLEAEVKWIESLNTFGKNGYNETKGGEGTCGRKLKKEQKEFLRNIKLGTKHTEETKKLMSESRRGRIFTEEHRKNLSKAQTGSKNHRYGKTCTEEQKKKISESLMGEKNPFYGKKHSEKTKKLLSKKNTGRFEGEKNPAARKCRIRNVIYLTGKELRKKEKVSISKFYSMLKTGEIRYED